MDALPSAPTAAPAPAQRQQQPTPTRKDRSRGKGRSPLRSTKSKSPPRLKSAGGNSKRSKQQPQPVPVPSADGKIAILKREGGGVAAATGAPTVADMEEVIRKSISSHFRKQESVLQAEVSKAVHAEMGSTVVPALDRALGLAVMDPLRETVAKSVKDTYKVRTSEVADAVCEAVRDPVVEAFNKTMKEVLVPAYESATRQMFSQASSAIESGLAAQKPTQDDSQLTQLIQSMSAQMNLMARSIEALSIEVAELRTVVNTTACANTAPIAQQVVDPTLAIRDEIVALLLSRDYEMSFTKALSASDGDIVVFACKNADLTDVLESSAGPALSQPILLCLMQQLGAVLASSNDEDLRVELAWLQDIAVSLDPTDESISRHLGGVLRQLVSNINEKMSQGDLSLRRPLQMLLQVIRGMVTVS